MNQGTAFAAFDQRLNLDPAERRAAQRVHQELTDHLISVGLIVGAFLQGSFARKTMRRPLHDVDKVVILPSAAEPSIRAMGGGPDRVMTELETAIARRLPGTQCERIKHALRLHLPGLGFHFDMVPAFEIAGDPNGDVLIANREGRTLDDEWERSNTRLLIATIARRNLSCAGGFIHWVRMGKEMVAHRIGDDFPGLQTESICYAANQTGAAYAVACARMFQAGETLLISGYTDPTGTDVISNRLDASVRARAQQAFRISAEHALEAQRYAEAGDHENACRMWHAIFGDAFPVPVAQTAREVLATSFAGGGITSVGTVTRTPVARQISRPTRSWAP